jgi:hypothetical protein
LSEALADLHYVTSLIVENARELIPGEAVDELALAWSKSEASMATLVHRLTTSPPPNVSPIAYTVLEQAELTGDVGKIKRSMLGRLKDRFLMYWNSEPRTDDKRMVALGAASDYLEFGGTVVGSIPGSDKIVEVLSLVKQLVGIRAKRGV